MADIADVEQAIASTITSILYPAGSSQSSIVGGLCRIYRGWPNSTTLNADLNTGAVNVTVTADNDSGRITTRYLPEWRTTKSQTGVTATSNGRTISISGNPAAGDVVGALVNGTAYSYRIQDGDTPSLVASNLGQLIQASHMASVSRSAVTIPGASSITVRVVCDGVTSLESRRQEKELRVICWCPSPVVRDLVASSIDVAMNHLNFLILQDDTNARIVYKNTASYDQAQNALLYRRDLVYTVEYATITVCHQPSMLFGASDLDGNITYG